MLRPFWAFWLDKMSKSAVSKSGEIATDFGLLSNMGPFEILFSSAFLVSAEGSTESIPYETNKMVNVPSLSMAVPTKISNIARSKTIFHSGSMMGAFVPLFPKGELFLRGVGIEAQFGRFGQLHFFHNGRKFNFLAIP